MLVTCAGKLAIVTGAASGIGRAVALSLARAGAAVTALDLNQEQLRETMQELRAAAPAAHHHEAVGDVSHGEFVDNVFQDAATRHGSVDILVNCAGITRDDWVWRTSDDMWDKVLDINLKGTFVTTRSMARFVKGQEAAAKKEGRQLVSVDRSIVNISSIVGKTGNIGQCNYAASKAGVVGLSKSAAKELARSGVRVNVIQPGFIMTPMAQAVPERVLEKVRHQVPLERLGRPEEVADLATFLASERSSYVTGGVFEVAGGLWM